MMDVGAAVGALTLFAAASLGLWVLLAVCYAVHAAAGWLLERMRRRR